MAMKARQSVARHEARKEPASTPSLAERRMVIKQKVKSPVERCHLKLFSPAKFTKRASAPRQHSCGGGDSKPMASA
jgi:hypothetical protein